MKRFTKFSILLLAAFFVSCGPSAEEKTRIQAQQEQATADSLAKAEALRLEQQRHDSIRQEVKKLYDKPITITVLKKSKRPSTIGEGEDVTLTCTVTNNTPITLSANDYKLLCTERYSRSSDGTVPDGYQSTSTKSVDLAPGESTQVTFSKQCIVDLSHPMVQLNIPEDEFTKRAEAALLPSK